MVSRLAATAGLALALAAPAQAGAPQGLKGFLLRADEPVTHTFSRTPSFAWKPVAGAKRYEFELSTSSVFRENGILFSDKTLTSPATSVPLTLPWITGAPYSLHARVRAETAKGLTPWSKPFGFNLRWGTVPTPLPTQPGLVRWTPVDGAGGYQVWFIDVPKVITVYSNVADQRELYTFHQGVSWTSSVRWRVRAVRWLHNKTVNTLPPVSYGPWSPVHTSVNPPFSLGPLTTAATVSDVVATGQSSDEAHRLMPAFVFGGNQTLGALGAELYRVYVFTDAECLNPVFKGAAVGGPAYAPRPYGPLALPTSLVDLALARGSYLGDGKEGAHTTADFADVTTTESAAAPTTPFPVDESTKLGAPVDLWDTNWPEGGYYWTVVAVAPFADASGALRYRELELPQEVCAAGRVSRFGKTSDPALTSPQAPFATGLSPTGRLVSASKPAPRFYGTPHVAWRPALGAAVYEVQWSKTRYPFRPAADSLYTWSTAATLKVAPGAWWYRVRGLNYALPTGAQQMSWSEPAQIVVARPTFRVER